MTGTPSPASLAPLVTFGVVGDYGSGGVDANNSTTSVVAMAAAGVATAMQQYVSPAIPSNFVVSVGDQVYCPWSQGDENEPATSTDYINAVGKLYGGFLCYPSVSYDVEQLALSPNPYTPPGVTPSETMRLFPAIGDHDWWKQKYRKTVTAPSPSLTESKTQEEYLMEGNDNYQMNFAGLEQPLSPVDKDGPCIRYYSVSQGTVPAADTPLVQLFALSNDKNEVLLGTLSTTASSSGNLDAPQIMWFQNALKASTAVWNIVFMHQPPYSSSQDHGPTAYFQLVDQVAAKAGQTVDLVLAGHVHSYERLQMVGGRTDPTTYIVNGAGGTLESFAPFYDTPAPSPQSMGVMPGSQIRATGFYGFQCALVTEQTLTLAFYGSQDPGNAEKKAGGAVWSVIDTVMIVKAGTVLNTDQLTGLTGLVIQGTMDNGVTSGLTIDTGGQDATVPVNICGPGSLTVTGGGTLTITAASVPGGVPTGHGASVFYETTQTGPSGPVSVTGQTTLVLYGTAYAPAAGVPEPAA
ncbi:hypothetical protein M2352_002731 [Azospirillum fermentarium]|uniref:metallophosphoesterase n=1 Tax=Azospirillum fermentarium TaxID=1233114 RepID=UPI0022266D8C|nr:metallophosphoesterase [Azospirillum fermentarium]MCW2247140.1 hypothetical protein [Azospirillum fermentarium]